MLNSGLMVKLLETVWYKRGWTPTSLVYPHVPSLTDIFLQSDSHTDDHCVCLAARGGHKGVVPGDSHPHTHQQEVGKQRARGQSRREAGRHHESDGRQADLSERGGQMCVRMRRTFQTRVATVLQNSFHLIAVLLSFLQLVMFQPATLSWRKYLPRHSLKYLWSFFC